MTPTFAAEEPVPVEEVGTPTEEVSAPTEEVAAPEETAVEAETNVDYLNYLELEDFIISAERIPTNKWDTPANITVITAQEIEENHYVSVGEALSHVNGWVAGQMTGGDRVLTLIDGRRTGMYPPMQAIERIEVLKGGNSALYGSDAFNGVVNVVTKKGTKNETSIDLNTGTWRHHRYNITNQGVVDKFSWFVTGTLEKSHASSFKRGYEKDTWDTSTPEGGEHTLSLRLDQRFTDSDSLTFDFSHKTTRIRYYYPYQRYYLPDSTNKYLTNFFSLTYNFKEGTSTPGWLRYVHNYYTYTNLGENPYERWQGVEYQNGWELGQHKIIAGLEWHKTTTKNEGLNIDANENTKSVYLQDTISMGDKWTLIPGFRYDHSSSFGSNWSPKIAANYRPDEKTKIYASWGKSYNAPSADMMYAGLPDDEIIDEAFKTISSPTFYYGGRGIQPEKGHSTLIGIEHDFDEKTGVTLSFFENKMKNLQQWLFDGPFYANRYGDSYPYYEYYAVNYYPLKSRGFELTYRQKINDHFSYNIGYSHTHTHMEHPDDGDIPYYRPQPNGYRIGLNYKNRGLKMNLLGVMASGINTNITTNWTYTNAVQAYPSKRYAVFDFNLSYDVNENLTFYFKALNLTNQHYSNRESNVYDGKKQVYPGSGREFIYGMNYKF